MAKKIYIDIPNSYINQRLQLLAWDKKTFLIIN